MNYNHSMDCFSRRQFLMTSALGCTWLMAASDGIANEESSYITLKKDGSVSEILLPPGDPDLWPEWRKALAQFRKEAREKLNYSGELYDRSDFAWAPKCFTCGFLMLNDQRLMDAQNGHIKVEQFLEEEK